MLEIEVEDQRLKLFSGEVALTGDLIEHVEEARRGPVETVPKSV